MQANVQFLPSFSLQNAPMASFRIVFSGEVLPGKRKDIVMLNFAERFNVPSGNHLRSLFSGQPKVLKKGIDEDTAIRYIKALESIGVKARREIEVPEVSSLLDITDNFFDAKPMAAPESHDLPEHYPQRLSEKLQMARSKGKKTIQSGNARKRKPTSPFDR